MVLQETAGTILSPFGFTLTQHEQNVNGILQDITSCNYLRYTDSQGILIKLPDIYRVSLSNELIPLVSRVSLSIGLPSI